MKNTAVTIALTALLAAWIGCAGTPVYTTDVPRIQKENEGFEITLEPRTAEGYSYLNAFRFVFTNKTQGVVEILWNETYYLMNGKRNGHFGWQGMTFEDLDRVRERPAIAVGPGETITQVLFPGRLLARQTAQERIRLGRSGPEGQFDPGPLPEGGNGMDLAVRQGGGIVREKLEFEVRSAPR